MSDIDPTYVVYKQHDDFEISDETYSDILKGLMSLIDSKEKDDE